MRVYVKDLRVYVGCDYVRPPSTDPRVPWVHALGSPAYVLNEAWKNTLIGVVARHTNYGVRVTQTLWRVKDGIECESP